MSSNPNHIIPVLTRDNYEEAFLLYVDEELRPDQKKAVDAFVLLHPDLKEELHLLCSTKLSGDALSFKAKEDLFADCMRLSTIDESLLLYIDNELPAGEAQLVEAQLKENTAVAKQYELLLKTKLDAGEQIPYPDKNSLYRRTERRIAPYWLRVAAAVILVAGTSTVLWLNADNTKPTQPDVTVATPKKDQPTAPVAKPDTIPVQANESNSVAATPKSTHSKKQNSIAFQAPVAAQRMRKKEASATFSKPHTGVAEHAVASTDLPVAKKTDASTLQTDIATKVAEPVLNNSTVTSAMRSTYVKVDAAERTVDPVPAVATTNERNGGVKVFLRKATRFIERRTGIKTVNDDDELLVGAVALKL